MGYRTRGFNFIPSKQLRNTLLLGHQALEWIIDYDQWETKYHGSSPIYPFSGELFPDVYFATMQATRLSYETQWFDPGLQSVEKISNQEMRGFLRKYHDFIRVAESTRSVFSPYSYWKLMMASFRPFRGGKRWNILASGLYDEQILQERNVFASSEGHFGVCPAEAAIGDKVVILRGSKVPLILRQRASGEQIFKLIGDAYVHGETFRETRPGN